MRRVVLSLALFVSLAAGVQPATAAELDRADFHYVRLVAAPGGEPVLIEPDGPLFEHSRPGFADLRITDGHGRPVPWRYAPPSDLRYLRVRVTGVSRIVGASVSGARERPRLLRRPVRLVSRREEGTRTIITLDLGFRRVPVDELRIAAGTPRYERPVAILGSNHLGRRFAPLAAARIFRFPSSSSAPISVRARHRYIRIEVDNGDDAPLRGIEVSAWSRSHALLLEGGHPRPYTVYYGNPSANAPSYDFARLPASAIGVERAVRGRLRPERETPAFEPPPDARSLAARNPGLVTAALVFAALVLAAAGLLTLRRRS
jgi:hypothetical protein